MNINTARRIGIQVLLGTIANVAVALAFATIPHLPLFMDTIFTVTVTLTGGLVAGLLTGFFSNILLAVARAFLGFDDLHHLAYALCNMASALVVYLYTRNRKEGLKPFDIILLSILVCLGNSIPGALISTFLYNNWDLFASDYLYVDLLTQGIKGLPASILSRIPMNLADKFIAVIVGYGIAFLIGRRKRREVKP